MGRVSFLVWCLSFASVFGGTWGVLLYVALDQDTGVVTGIVLFLIGFKSLYHVGQYEDAVPLRRFNDNKGDL